MKHFSNLTEAIFYRTSCPICHKNLRFQNIPEYSLFGETISLCINTEIGDMITIHAKNGIIEEISITRDSNNLNVEKSYKHSAFASTDYSIYNDLLNSYITVSCYECEQFCYRIRVQIELTNMKFHDLFLESESISIEEHPIFHEIKNDYDKNETTFSSIYPDSLNDKVVNIPLIPLNLDNPSETLDRIKKLLIFS